VQAVAAVSTELAATVRELEDIVGTYTPLAIAEVAPARQAHSTVNDVVPGAARKLQGKTRVPVLSLPLPKQPDGKYDDLPYVAKVHAKIRFVGGVNAPKLLYVEDNFGKVCTIIGACTIIWASTTIGVCNAPPLATSGLAISAVSNFANAWHPSLCVQVLSFP
jgi:hypothetical protein